MPSSKKAHKAAAALPESIVEATRVGDDFKLADVDPHGTPGFAGDKALGTELLAESADEISELQERLYAEARGENPRSLLLVIQGMDTSGKGGIMRHVVGLLDPQGVDLTAFKQPTAEEKRHPFLWRIRKALPRPGQIGVFDRSHYEDVLVVRVNDLVPASTWKRRFGQIRSFESKLADSGTRIVKVMLHVSKEEQGERLAERLDRPDKHWKYNPGDIDERRKWEAYQEAYQEALVKTSTDQAPWFVVPADRKWFARLAVQQILLETLREMDPQWPAVDLDVAAEKKRLADS
ncbi:polyphosphate kinase 2 family protein [Gephyromycinifex aptenodytis]|uniref:polyphosphate kinase 2 family protein n=1 Tax=Gephyromycinifex aptenodytis TaxID=2716227 RepID=UPI0014454E3B|nr:polyphosphate kinase 2 family protein [Gephyromycinifex aptenodytis]